MASLKQIAARLFGISAFQGPPVASSASLDQASIKDLRADYGGRIVPFPQNQTRFYIKDVEEAIKAASAGDLTRAGLLWKACRRDGVMAGVIAARTGGLVRLPKKFRGDPAQVGALEVGHESVRSVYDEMFPPAELALLIADGIALGVGVGELVEVKGRDYPVLRRMDPMWLVYRITEDRWYYRSIVGLLPISPGDGRWILHLPGGRNDPWENGIWSAIGTSWINKQHSALHVANWESKLANPARVAVSPQGATEAQEQSWFQAVMAWGKNTVFGMKPGYDVKLLESNGRGHESFVATIERSEREMIVAWSGQSVSTDGGAGFINGDLFKNIRADLIQADGEALAYTINTQGIPPFIVKRFGVEALDTCALVRYDTTPPGDRNGEIAGLGALGTSIKLLGEAVQPEGISINVPELLQRYNVPVLGDENGDGAPDNMQDVGVITLDESEYEVTAE